MRYKCWQCCWKSLFLGICPWQCGWQGGRLSSTAGAAVLAGPSAAPAAAHVQGRIWDQQEHQMCINFKCTINDTFFPWIRHIGCDAQPQGNVSSKADAAQAALT